MRNGTVFMENGQPLGEELLNIAPEQFEIIEREAKIVDADFRTESVSYGKDVLRRFLRDRVTVTAAVIILVIVAMAPISAPTLTWSRTGRCRICRPGFLCWRTLESATAHGC